MGIFRKGDTGSGFVRTPNTELFNLTEQQLVSEILLGSSRLYEFFGFVMTDVHGLRGVDGWDYLIFANLLRTDLGLTRLGQPGDIDVLIIPHCNGELHVEKTAAIEVKRLSLKERIGARPRTALESPKPTAYLMRPFRTLACCIW